MSFVRRAYHTALSLGLDPRRFYRSVRGAPKYFMDYNRYRRTTNDGLPPLGTPYPILTETSDEAGTTKGHYFHQDLWAAEKIIGLRPKIHIDVGSRIDGFVAHLLAARVPVRVLDIRPLNSVVRDLTFLQGDAVRMEGFPDRSVESLSSLHAVEHFGLGRYGDPIDPLACFEAMKHFARVLAFGGRLYFSVPVGRERVEFNAHRIFDPLRPLKCFPELTLLSFAGVNDSGDLVTNSTPQDFQDAEYSCGLYEFTRAE